MLPTIKDLYTAGIGDSMYATIKDLYTAGIGDSMLSNYKGPNFKTLCRRTTSELFHTLGIKLSLEEWLKITTRDPAKSWRTQFGIPSGPGALFSLMDINFFSPSFTVTHVLKEFSINNEGKSCYIHLVQDRHDGMVFTEVRGKNQATCLH